MNTVAALYLSKVERDLANLLQVSPSGSELSAVRPSRFGRTSTTPMSATRSMAKPNGRSRSTASRSPSINPPACVPPCHDEEQVGLIVKFNFQKIDLPSESNSVVVGHDATQRSVRVAGGLHEGARVYLDRNFGSQTSLTLKGAPT